MTLAAFTVQSVGAVLAFLVVLAVVGYFFVNVRYSGKRELGSEIEVAANRKPYLSDEDLEGPKLERTLTWALVTLFVIAIGLPLYWILEPGRQAGAKDEFGRRFAQEGAELFAPVGDNLNALGCAGCHGGMKATGGASVYNITEPDGSITSVNWQAPALDTVLLRYSREEVTFILTYGRPFSPMPAWGVEGGGPLNEQQVQNLVDYIETIQLTPEQAQQQVRDQLADAMELTDEAGRPLYGSEGEALFNLGLTNGFAGGAYSCGRCHTQGWSYTTDYDELKPITGCGALGPSLCGTSVEEQFPALETAEACPVRRDGTFDASVSVTTTTAPGGAGPTASAAPGGAALCTNPFTDHFDFVSEGSESGEEYGRHGQGSGKMPGFGLRPAETALFYINDGAEREEGPGMYPPDLLQKVIEYERGL